MDNSGTGFSKYTDSQDESGAGRQPSSNGNDSQDESGAGRQHPSDNENWQGQFGAGRQQYNPVRDAGHLGAINPNDFAQGHLHAGQIMQQLENVDNDQIEERDRLFGAAFAAPAQRHNVVPHQGPMTGYNPYGNRNQYGEAQQALGAFNDPFQYQSQLPQTAVGIPGYTSQFNQPFLPRPQIASQNTFSHHGIRPLPTIPNAPSFGPNQFGSGTQFNFIGQPSHEPQWQYGHPAAAAPPPQPELPWEVERESEEASPLPALRKRKVMKRSPSPAYEAPVKRRRTRGGGPGHTIRDYTWSSLPGRWGILSEGGYLRGLPPPWVDPFPPAQYLSYRDTVLKYNITTSSLLSKRINGAMDKIFGKHTAKHFRRIHKKSEPNREAILEAIRLAQEERRRTGEPEPDVDAERPTVSPHGPVRQPTQPLTRSYQGRQQLRPYIPQAPFIQPSWFAQHSGYAQIPQAFPMPAYYHIPQYPHMPQNLPQFSFVPREHQFQHFGPIHPQTFVPRLDFDYNLPPGVANVPMNFYRDDNNYMFQMGAGLPYVRNDNQHARGDAFEQQFQGDNQERFGEEQLLQEYQQGYQDVYEGEYQDNYGEEYQNEYQEGFQGDNQELHQDNYQIQPQGHYQGHYQGQHPVQYQGQPSQLYFEEGGEDQDDPEDNQDANDDPEDGPGRSHFRPPW